MSKEIKNWANSKNKIRIVQYFCILDIQLCYEICYAQHVPNVYDDGLEPPGHV